MATYLLGVLTPVALFLLYAIGEWVYHRLRDAWLRYKPGFRGRNLDDRIYAAAHLVLTRRFLRIRLPGGTVIAYASHLDYGSPVDNEMWRLRLRDDGYVLRSALRTAVAECQSATEKGETP